MLSDIAEWKPDKKVGNICTMVIKQNTELEDNGIKIEGLLSLSKSILISGQSSPLVSMLIIGSHSVLGIKIEKPDGTPFLPNFALKVEDVTDNKKEEMV